MKPSFRDVEHLVRLALLFAGGVLVFVIVRAVMMPEDFGRYGHYRAASIGDARARPISRAADAAWSVTKTPRPPSHPPGTRTSAARRVTGRLQSTPRIPRSRQSVQGLTDCVRCHASAAGKPPQYPMIDVAEHSDPVACISCHDPHDLRDKEQ